MFTPQIAAALAPDPILINSCEDLNAISANTASLAASYKLNTDIDCSSTATQNPNESEWVDGIVGGTLINDSYTGVVNNGYSGFDPIGGPQDNFTGTFDGNGKVISNLWIFRKETSFVGLFGFTYKASIHDLTLTNSSIVGQQYTGGLVGVAGSTSITRVTVNNSMARAYLSYNGGGIAGYTFKDSDTDTSIISESSVLGGSVHGSGNIIGGLIGSMNGGILSGSTTSANVDGGYSIGGAIGELSGGMVNLVTVTSDATVQADYRENVYVGGVAKSGDKVGGFVGYMTGGDIRSSSTAATVESEGINAGGFVGQMQDFSPTSKAKISGSHATGLVTGHGNVNGNSPNNTNSYNVGGFAGIALGEGVEISDSYATGNVVVDYLPTANPAFSVGGFAGSGGCKSSITNSYASGNVTAPHATEVGGFVGDDSCEGVGGTYLKVYASGDVQGDVSVGGFIGSGSQTTITKSYASGSVTGNQYVGGLGGYLSGGAYNAGDSTSKINKSYSKGNVSATGDSAGGLFGFVSGSSINDVYSRGAVSGNGNVGGLIGEIADSWQLTHAYSTGGVEATDHAHTGGMIGNDVASGVAEGTPIYYSLYFDQQSSGLSTDNRATPKNTNEMKLVVNQPTFEADPNVNPDINGFDFATIWEFASTQNNDYPVFKWQLDPTAIITCEQTHLTSTTARILCEVGYHGGDSSRATPADWNVTRYRKTGDTDWINIDSASRPQGKAIFYNLNPNTSYEFSMHVNNNFIDEFATLEGTTRAENSDHDNDGVLDSVENNGPNKGDANNDGILDSEQASVTNFLNPITGNYVAINTGTCNGGVNGSLNKTTSVVPESTDHKDAGYSYPAGVMGFSTDCYNPCCDCMGTAALSLGAQSINGGSPKVSAQCCPCGAPLDVAANAPHSFTISQYWFGNYTAQDFIARKYNSVTNAYSTIPGATITNVVIGGQNAVKLAYEIVDNGPLDEDPAVGKIKDPSGPALLVVNTPNTGFGGNRK
ncbi:MAG: hypothetical protein NTX11_00540 [Candidatus Saccharibacteria bacterium]|nr:hypothetical protein [Candidatus Saccharibacteria bacterium]